MIREAPWRPRCCHACGEPLESWGHELQPETYVGCFACARLYVAVDGGLESVVFSLEAPELARVFAELVQEWWAGQARPSTQPAARAA